MTKLSKSKEYLQGERGIIDRSRKKAASPSPLNDDFSSLEARPGPRTRPHREESGLNSTKFSFNLEQQRSSEAPRRAVGRFNPLIDDKRLSRESVFMQSISKNSEKGGVPSATESPLKELSLAGGSVALRDVLVYNEKSFPGMQERGAVADLGYSFDGAINITSEEFAPRRKLKKPRGNKRSPQPLAEYYRRSEVKGASRTGPHSPRRKVRASKFVFPKELPAVALGADEPSFSKDEYILGLMTHRKRSALI